jgi:hypothetical protein
MILLTPLSLLEQRVAEADRFFLAGVQSRVATGTG